MEEIPRSMEVPEIEKHPERTVVATCLRAGSKFDPVVVRPMPLCFSDSRRTPFLGIFALSESYSSCWGRQKVWDIGEPELACVLQWHSEKLRGLANCLRDVACIMKR